MIEEAMKEQAEASRELAAAMRYYADTLRGVASGQIAGQVAAPSTNNEAAGEAATTKGGRGKKSETAAKAAPAKEEPKEVDPFGEEEAEEEAEPELTADTIRTLVLKVKEEKGADIAKKLLKALGVETMSKIAEKDYQKVVDLAKKVGVTL